MMDIERLLGSLEDALVVEIPTVVGKTFFMEPLYAILIDYFHWSFTPTLDLETSPPLIIAAPLSVRRAILDGHEYADCVQWDAGYVAEIDDSVRIQLPRPGKAAAHCSEFYHNIDEDDERPGPMLQRVAARLNSVNWRSITKVTDDFIVCLQDSHGGHDNQEDIDACVPPDRISLLRSRNLLWRW